MSQFHAQNDYSNETMKRRLDAIFLTSFVVVLINYLTQVIHCYYERSCTNQVVQLRIEYGQVDPTDDPHPNISVGSQGGACVIFIRARGNTESGQLPHNLIEEASFELDPDPPREQSLISHPKERKIRNSKMHIYQCSSFKLALLVVLFACIYSCSSNPIMDDQVS